MNDAWTQILIFVAVALVLNFLWFYLGWSDHTSNYMYKRNRLIPAGWFIAIVWTVLFGFFGYTHYLLINENNGEENFASICVLIYAGWCVLYPFIVNIVGNKYIQVVNLLSLIVGFTVGIIVIQAYETAFWFFIPVIVWCAYICFADSVYSANLYKNVAY